MKIFAEVLLVAGVMIAAGCSNNTEEIKPVETECGSCTGGVCKIPQNLAMNTLKSRKIPGSVNQANAVKDTSKAGYNPEFAAIPTVDELMPEDRAFLRKIEEARAENRALAGKPGQYNEVKLPGMGHKELPQEQNFVVRTFKSDIWPGGVELEAEIDPEIATF